MATVAPPAEPSEQVPPAAPEPAVETPAEGAAPGDGGAPAPVAEGDGTGGGESTSPAPAALGSEDADVRFALDKHKGDTQALARDWTRLNNEIGSLKKDQEELARLRASGAEGKPPAAEAAAPRVERAPSSAQVEADAEKRANDFVVGDPYAKSLHKEFHENLPRLNELGLYDDRQKRFVSGTISAMDEQIRTIETALAAHEKPVPGMPPLNWGEFEVENAKRVLRDLKSDRRDAVSEWRELAARNKGLADQYDARFDQAKGHFKQERETHQQRQEEQAQETQVAQSFDREYKAALTKVCDELQVKKDPAVRDAIRDRFIQFYVATRLPVGRDPNPTTTPAETEAVVREFLAKEREYAGTYTDEAVRAYAAAKKADAGQPAPKGKQAIVPSEPEGPEAWKRRWEVEKAQPVLDRIAKKRAGR